MCALFRRWENFQSRLPDFFLKEMCCTDKESVEYLTVEFEDRI